MKKILLSFLAIILLVPTIALASSTFKKGEQLILTEPINNDAYLSGSVVQVDQPINGSLWVAGGRITVNAKVSKGVVLAGGNITLSGEVGDGAKLGAGNVTVSSKIKGDLFIGGGNTELTKESAVQGDLIVGSGNVILNGLIDGNVIGVGGNYYINDQVKGSVKLYRVQKLVFGPGAKIGGNLDYRSSEEIKIPNGVVAGKTIYTALPLRGQGEAGEGKWIFAGMLAGFSAYNLLAMLFFGLFLIWLLPFYGIHVVSEVYGKALKTMGIGFLFLILTPITAFILLFTVIGIPISLVLIGLWVLALYFGKIFAAMLIGWKILPVNEKSGFGRLYGAYALGALIYVILCLIPIIGWVLKDLLILMAMGGMAMYKIRDIFPMLRDKKMI